MRVIDLNKIPHKAFRGDRDDLVDALFAAPTVDAVAVVRCKECKNGREKENGYYACDWSAFLTRGDWYCSHGECKGGDTDG